MNTVSEKYLSYATYMQRKAYDMITQSNPNTAYGCGLDDIAEAIAIMPRQKRGDFTEVDSELRCRILEAMGIGTW